ncbi:MAG: arylsulfatase [Alistipes sp.]|nr:arylsulfatase [Alistipes sp.]
MNYYRLLAGTALVGSVACASDNNGPEPDPTPPPTGGDSPNVILILTDDLGYGDISALNPQSKIRTQNIDNLCSHGVVFTDVHASSSLSTPSRYSILTGRYAWRTTLKSGATGGFARELIPSGRTTIADIFAKSGYHTACIGKWHVGLQFDNVENGNDNIDYSRPVKNGPTSRGFEYFYGIAGSLDMPPYVYIENDRVVQVPSRIMPARTGLELMRSGVAAEDFIPEEVFPNIIGRTVQYITECADSDRPFFLYVPITAPHTPILPSPEFQGKSAVGPYGDFVLQIDDMVRQVTEVLEQTGQAENTIVIFTSDNGCAAYIQTKQMENMGHFPSYIYRGYKTDIYEGGHRVPFIVSWGSRFNGRVDNSLVSLTDLMATFAEMLGYTVPSNHAEDSFSFWPAIESGAPVIRPSLVATSGEGWFSYRMAADKLIFTDGSGGDGDPSGDPAAGPLPPMQFYDLSYDPHEDTNLINERTLQERIAEMTAGMRDVLVNGRSTPGNPLQNDTANDWTQTQPFVNYGQ